MSNTENKFKPRTYEVTVCDQVYYYALHSDRKNKIIFPSQVLNVLEYVLFRKMKDGFRATDGIITLKEFPFKVERLKDGKADDTPWIAYDIYIESLRSLLQNYYDSALELIESENANA